MDWKTLFLSPEGRIGQKDFWLGALILFVLICLLQWIPIIGPLLSLILIYAGICLCSKRLHDMGRSGFLQLIPIGIGLVCVVVGGAIAGVGVLMSMSHGDSFGGLGALAGGMMAMSLFGVCGLVGLVFMLWLGLSASQAGANAYGPPQSGSHFDSVLSPGAAHPPATGGEYVPVAQPAPPPPTPPPPVAASPEAQPPIPPVPSPEPPAPEPPAAEPPAS